MKTVTIMLDNDEVGIAYSDDDTPLTTEEIGQVLAQLLADTLGDEPQISDLFAIQKSMGAALSRIPTRSD